MNRFDAIFIDMDDVLCKWREAACALWELDMTTLPLPQPFEIADHLGVDMGTFWKKIDDQWDFWSSLEKTPWCNEILSMANDLSDCVRILTSQHKHEYCYAGKCRWLQDHGIHVKDILCKDKWLLAKPNRVLIDDKDENLTLFENAGGVSIIFPRPWNKAYRVSHSPMFYLGQQFTAASFGELHCCKEAICNERQH